MLIDTATAETNSTGLTIVGSSDGTATLGVNNVITGSDDPFAIGFGNDTISSDGFSDTISGRGGNDTITYLNTVASSIVSIDGGDGNDTINFTSGVGAISTVIGGAGNDTIVNLGAGASSIDGGTGADTITGGTGNDTIIGGQGADVINGGLGTNTFNSAEMAVANADGGTANPTGVVVNLGATTLTSAQILTATGGAPNGSYTAGGTLAVASGATSYLLAGAASGQGLATTQDTLSNIQNVIGSNLDDYIVGSDVNNSIEGGNGNDTIQASAGADTLSGGGGVLDTLRLAQAANGTLIANNATINLTTFASQALSVGNSITLVANGLNANIEDIDASGQLNSQVGLNLIGGSNENYITGGAGNDTITGAAKADLLTGGLGNDRFVFAVGDSFDRTALAGIVATYADGVDVITDFTVNAGQQDSITGALANTGLQSLNPLGFNAIFNGAAVQASQAGLNATNAGVKNFYIRGTWSGLLSGGAGTNFTYDTNGLDYLTFQATIDAATATSINNNPTTDITALFATAEALVLYNAVFV